ncbi:MAG: transposase, partial [bacterium]|nr:transposase [bacterium]
MEHAYSQDETAGKVFYFLMQLAHLIFQLVEKGSLF